MAFVINWSFHQTKVVKVLFTESVVGVPLPNAPVHQTMVASCRCFPRSVVGMFRRKSLRPQIPQERYAYLYGIISYHSISYHIISYHIISYHIILYHIISYHFIRANNNLLLMITLATFVGIVCLQRMKHLQERHAGVSRSLQR